MKLLLDPVLGDLGAKILSFRDFQIVRVHYKRFPDGEEYIRILDDVRDEQIAVITTGYPEQNSAILRALLALKALKDAGASHAKIVFAYFPYARQDKVFLPGEAVSARVVAEVLLKYADELFFVDVHSEEVYKGLPVKNLKATKVWAEYVSKLENVFLIAPDKGRVEYVSEVAKLAGVEFTFFEKKRDLESGKIIGHEPGEPERLAELCEKADIAVILDDIISTGGTAANVIKALRNYFEGKIIAAFTHGLFLPGAVEKLIAAGANEIVATDTVKNSFSKVSVAKLIAEALS